MNKNIFFALIIFITALCMSNAEAAKITAVKIGSRIDVTIDGKFFHQLHFC